MDPRAFYNQYNGRFVDTDGLYGAQCTDLFNAFCRMFGIPFIGTPATGGARDLYEVFPAPASQYFDRIANTDTFVPQRGDWLIYGSQIGPYGHVEMFWDGDVRSYDSFSQNWPMGSNAHLIHHDSYYGVLGVLRPKALATNTPQGGDKMNDPWNELITREHADFIAARLLGRTLSDAEYKAGWDGHTRAYCWEICSTNAEATAHAAQVGATFAERDQLRVQAQSQQKSIDALNLQLSTLQAKQSGQGQQAAPATAATGSPVVETQQDNSSTGTPVTTPANNASASSANVDLAQYAKAIVGATGFALDGAAQAFGVANPYVHLAIGVATALGIYHIPNKQ